MKRCGFRVYEQVSGPGSKGRALKYSLVQPTMVLKPSVPFSSGSYVEDYGPVVPLTAPGLDRGDVVEKNNKPGFIDWGFDPMPITCSDFFSKEDKWSYAAILLQVGIGDQGEDESAYEEEERFMQTGAEGCLVQLHGWEWYGQEGHIPLLVRNRYVCVLCNKKFDVRCWHGRCDDCADTEAKKTLLLEYFKGWSWFLDLGS